MNVRTRVFTGAAVSLALFMVLVLTGCGSSPAQSDKTPGANLPTKQFYNSLPLHKVQVDDIEIGYKIFGKGPPLFMITAFASTMDMWDQNFLMELAKHNQVIIFDNRGMGETTAGNPDWTIDVFAQDAVGLMTALGYKRANVLGWSVGGDTALSLVTYDPGRVKKLISYAGDCGGTHKVDPPPSNEIEASVHDVFAPGKVFFASLFPPEWLAANPGFLAKFPIPTSSMDPKSIKKQLDAYNNWEGVYEFLPDIKNPVLCLTGDQDVSTPTANAYILYERIPNSTLVVFTDGGHGIQYQDPKAVASSINAFLASKKVKHEEITVTAPK